MQQYLWKYSHWLCTLYLHSLQQIFVSFRNLRGVCAWNPMATSQRSSKSLSPNLHIHGTSPLLENTHSPVRSWLILYLLYKSSTFLFWLFHRVSPTSVLFVLYFSEQFWHSVLWHVLCCCLCSMPSFCCSVSHFWVILDKSVQSVHSSLAHTWRFINKLRKIKSFASF